ncbi:MAG: HAD-IA family hydrolase [Lachnospiraceae bacterium]|nr:HAD-IA family hydrolase [Lachnospiraceae bacterium]
MIKAVIFDMFETLASLFEGRTYFSEDIAFDLGLPHDAFRAAWHLTEEDRTIGKCTIAEAAALTLKRLGTYSKESVSLIEQKRKENLSDTFQADLSESVAMLKKLKDHGLLTGLISNCYSDERDMIRESVLYPYIDVPVLSYECGICKPDARIFLDCTQKLGVLPSECLYVGDGGSGELPAAEALGMKPLQALYYHHLAFEPHIPCDVLPQYEHLYARAKLFDHL